MAARCVVMAALACYGIRAALRVVPSVCVRKMNVYVLRIKDRLPARLRSRLGANYHQARSFIALVQDVVRDMVRSTRILLSHLSAEIVPGYYWRRLKRLFIARRA
jgi:hypothetical protein